MTANACSITIHMVASLDGIIAKKDNSVSWLETTGYYEKGIEITEHAINALLATIDCYVMGAHTYEHAMELSASYGWPYGNVPTIVVTHRNLPVKHQQVELYSGDLDKLVNERLKPHFRNVWMVGGAMLASAFIRLQLADSIRLSVMPVILGDGIPLFDHAVQEQVLQLKEVIPYKSGMVELFYEIKK